MTTEITKVSEAIDAINREGTFLIHEGAKKVLLDYLRKE